jgi:glycosyltransferase involved in cell wall biosynthesis
MFGEDGYWGGGERYPLELARAQAELVPTRLISFGSRARRERTDELELVVLPARHRYRGDALNPLAAAMVPELGRAQVVHVHQYHTLLTDLVLLLGAIGRRRVFVTDHGGSAPNLGRYFPRLRLMTGLLAVSRYSAGLLPYLQSRATVIYGGADPARFHPSEGPRGGVVFVGRLLPHKGVDVLIEAADADMEVSIYGRGYDRRYREKLERLARGKHVRFFDQAGDDQVVGAYQTARAVVLPSVLQSPYGPSSPKAELLGLAQIEAMACGTPVVCSRVGPLEEVAVDGETGYVVPPGDPAALRARLRELLSDDRVWTRMSDGALARARSKFTWRATAERALAAYGI